MPKYDTHANYLEWRVVSKVGAVNKQLLVPA